MRRVIMKIFVKKEKPICTHCYTEDSPAFSTFALGMSDTGEIAAFTELGVLGRCVICGEQTLIEHNVVIDDVSLGG